MTCLLVVALGLTACTGSEVPCSSRPTDPLCQPIDGGGVDSGGDGGRDVGMIDAPMVDAHIACNGMCTGTIPHCLLATETCVGCLGDGDCTGANRHCETTTSHACVACLAAADCVSPTASVCSASHACAPCTVNSDCAHLTGVGVCNAGTCVTCTPGDESACAANSCNPALNTCTTTARGSVATCHACVADSECSSAMDRCVPMQFMGAAHGSYCLRPVSAGCARPLTVTTVARASASGAAAAAYCAVDETVTTCEGLAALIADTACTMPTDCGASSLADGRCETVSGVANRCTYSCGTSSQCPSGVTCGGAGYCGS